MAYRDRTIGELGPDSAGTRVQLAGWVASRRDHGGMVFFNLRDRWDQVQAVVRPDAPDLMDRAAALKIETVVSVTGTVRARPEGLTNPDMRLGGLEVEVEGFAELAGADALPFVLAEGDDVAPLTRMQYRYLDMRRPAVRDALVFRHRCAMAVRNFLSGRGFVDVETPMLTRSTPEGARDYLVPSRVHPRTCYALPQSPQLFKQLLMVAGFDRYFQIVRCFRDEDQRADRQPEFTQIDVEMSFVEAVDVMETAEALTAHLFQDLLGKAVDRPIPRIPYADAMARYGSDKPDLRYGMAFRDVTDLTAGCGFKVFSSQKESGGSVLGFAAPGAGGYSRRQVGELEETGKKGGLKGLVTLKAEDGGFKGSVAKFFEKDELTALGEALEASPGDLLVLAAGPRDAIAEGLGDVRVKLGYDLGLADPKTHAFCWVVDPPLFFYNDDEQRYDAVHHPFTAPRPEDEPLLDTDPAAVRAQAYDLVLNGFEVAGGSVRIHRAALQQKVFGLLALTPEKAEEKFGFLLEAFRYGAPPHGGIAFGYDRLVALMLGFEYIRDVIAFPKTTRAFCPLTGAPGTVGDEQLKELALGWRPPSPRAPAPEGS